MESLSFVEFCHVREKKQKSFTNYNMCNTFSLVVNVPSDNGIRDITYRISSGDYYFKPGYTLLYLYDFMEDDESRDFLKFYGGNLHRETSANISIVTYYTKQMVDEWTNIPYRELLSGSDEGDYNQIIDKVKVLKDLYNVKKLPALVVIKNNDELDESCVIEVAGLKRNGIYNMVMGVIRMILNNYEEDFSVLTDKLEGREYSKNKNIEKFSTYNFIASLVKKDKFCTLTTLANDLHIDVKTLYNKRVSATFTRDECLFIGARFGITVSELNKLLKENGRQELGFAGRDGLVRKALINDQGLYELIDELEKNGFDGLLKNEYNE